MIIFYYYDGKVCQLPFKNKMLTVTHSWVRGEGGGGLFVFVMVCTLTKAHVRKFNKVTLVSLVFMIFFLDTWDILTHQNVFRMIFGRKGREVILENEVGT